MTESHVAVRRIRLTYARGEALRYVSHLDLQTVWERIFRRARLPLAYSQGFNPHPRLHLASALPLGYLSRCEIMDVWLEGQQADLTPQEVWQRAQQAAPPGLEIYQAEETALDAPAIQTQVQAARFRAEALDPQDVDQLAQTVAALLNADTLPRTRRSKAYDLRPLIENLELESTDGKVVLRMGLMARESATGRPDEVLDALGLDPTSFRVERTELILG